MSFDGSDDDDFSQDEAAYEVVQHDVAETLAHDLESRHSKRPSNLSNVLASTSVQLEHQLTADRLAHALHEPRTSGLQMSHAGEGVSSVLLATQHELDRNLKASAVSHQLGRRSSQQDLVDRGVLPQKSDAMSSVLAAPARELEKNMRHDQLHSGFVSLAQRKSDYLSNATASTGSQPAADAGGALTVKQRMEQYKQQVTASATKSYSPAKQEQQQQQAEEAPSSSPAGLSLKDRLLAYTSQASASNVKKQVDVNAEMANAAASKDEEKDFEFVE